MIRSTRNSRMTLQIGGLRSAIRDERMKICQDFDRGLWESVTVKLLWLAFDLWQLEVFVVIRLLAFSWLSDGRFYGSMKMINKGSGFGFIACWPWKPRNMWENYQASFHGTHIGGIKHCICIWSFWEICPSTCIVWVGSIITPVMCELPDEHSTGICK